MFCRKQSQNFSPKLNVSRSCLAASDTAATCRTVRHFTHEEIEINFELYLNELRNSTDPAAKHVPLRGKLMGTFALIIIIGKGYEKLSVNPMLGPSIESLISMGGLRTSLIQAGDWWRLIWAGYLHAGWFHVLMNFFLWYKVGVMIEPDWGFLRTAIVFNISVLSGNLFSATLDPYHVSVGASGGIFGVMGGCVPYVVEYWHTIRQPRLLLYIVSGSLVLGLVCGFLPYVDNYAHIGGTIGGILSGFITISKIEMGTVPPARRLMSRNFSSSRSIDNIVRMSTSYWHDIPSVPPIASPDVSQRPSLHRTLEATVTKDGRPFSLHRGRLSLSPSGVRTPSNLSPNTDNRKATNRLSVDSVVEELGLDIHDGEESLQSLGSCSPSVEAAIEQYEDWIYGGSIEQELSKTDNHDAAVPASASQKVAPDTALHIEGGQYVERTEQYHSASPRTSVVTGPEERLREYAESHSLSVGSTEVSGGTNNVKFVRLAEDLPKDISAVVPEVPASAVVKADAAPPTAWGRCVKNTLTKLHWRPRQQPRRPRAPSRTTFRTFRQDFVDDSFRWRDKRVWAVRGGAMTLLIIFWVPLFFFLFICPDCYTPPGQLVSVGGNHHADRKSFQPRKQPTSYELTEPMLRSSFFDENYDIDDFLLNEVPPPPSNEELSGFKF